MALVLTTSPGAVDAAGAWSVSVLTNSCTVKGGKYGNGRLVQRVRGYERGSTGTDRMRMRASVQEWNGSRWTTLVTGRWSTSARIPDDRDTYFVTWGSVRWDTPDILRTRYHRLRTTVQFLRKGKLQRSISKFGRPC